jgi:hypothetical protein
MKLSIKARALQALSRACEHVTAETGRLRDGKGQLEGYPIYPGRVHGTIGPVLVRDDSSGHLRDLDDRKVADISYVTGAFELEPWFQLFRDANFKISYFFNPDKKTPVHTDMRLVDAPMFMCCLASAKLNKKATKRS